MMKKLLFSFALGLALLPISAHAAIIPTGRALSGDLTITSGTVTDNSVDSNIVATSTAGVASTTVSSVTGFAAGQYVMLVQMSGSGVGQYEFQEIRSIVGSSLFFYSPLSFQYDKDSTSTAQVVKVSEYHNVNISGGTWTAANWNGTTGGVLVAFLTGSLNQTGGTIAAPSGFAGGGGNQVGVSSNASQGNGTPGIGGLGTGANGNAGGGGQAGCSDTGGGGGGGNGAGGSTGGASGCDVPGIGGNTSGNVTLSLLTFGGAGGGGACSYNINCINGGGGNGTGIIYLTSASSTLNAGSFTANGSVGGPCSSGTGGGGGGAGAGGSIRLPVRLNITFGSSVVTATGASGGSTSCISGGGSSGVGRIATVSSAVVSGTTNPTINTSSTDFVYNVDNAATQVALSFSI